MINAPERLNKVFWGEGWFIWLKKRHFCQSIWLENISFSWIFKRNHSWRACYEMRLFSTRWETIIKIIYIEREGRSLGEREKKKSEKSENFRTKNLQNKNPTLLFALKQSRYKCIIVSGTPNTSLQPIQKSND